MKVRDTDYILVTGWMRNHLGLSGNSLNVYAMIHGFTKDGENEFHGSLDYIQQWTGCSKKTAITTLQKLVEEDLIIKREWIDKNGSNTAYKINPDKLPETQQVGGVKITPQGCKNYTDGGVKITPNNNINNTNIPPITPQGEDNGIISRDDMARFETFYKAYPRKANKVAALKAWKKLKVTDELLQTMLSAIKVQKKSKQWQDKEHIPHPSTWLNGRRWEDEDEFHPLTEKELKAVQSMGWLV